MKFRMYPSSSNGRMAGRFRRVIAYEAGERPGAREVLYCGNRNVFGKNLEEIIQEFEALVTQNLRVKDPLHRVILSWLPGENPTKNQIEEAVDIYIDGMGLSECCVFYGGHQDECIHVDICANTLDPITAKPVRLGNGWKIRTAKNLVLRIQSKQGWRRN